MRPPVNAVATVKTKRIRKPAGVVVYHRRHRKALVHRKRRCPSLRVQLWAMRQGYNRAQAVIRKILLFRPAKR